MDSGWGISTRDELASIELRLSFNVMTVRAELLHTE